MRVVVCSGVQVRDSLMGDSGVGRRHTFFQAID
jgi:hypothetical protein